MNDKHFPRNLKQYEIAKEVPTPKQVGKMEEPKMLGLIYKAVFYCLVVLLDIRYNTSNTKRKREKFLANPVIKDSDLKFSKEMKPNER